MSTASRRAGWIAAAVFALSPLSSFSSRCAFAQGSQGRGGTPGSRPDFPCASCVTIAPPSYAPEKAAPLFVALHGDEGSTRVILPAWKGPLERRGYIFLALRCPKEEGCSNSYWRWGGDPSWILRQVDAVEAAYNVDRARIYLSGWSGGSTYMGIAEPLLSPRFAALNLNGGGAAPFNPQACAPCKAPVYYFMGGKNPLVSLAEAARDHFKRCGHDLVWDFAPALSHAGELRALQTGAVPERVLAWLETKQNTCIKPVASASSPSNAGDADAGASGGEPTTELTPDTGANPPPDGEVNAASDKAAERAAAKPALPPPPDPRARPVGGCGCRPSTGGTPAASFGALAGLTVLRASIRRRRLQRLARTSPPPKRST